MRKNTVQNKKKKNSVQQNVSRLPSVVHHEASNRKKEGCPVLKARLVREGTPPLPPFLPLLSQKYKTHFAACVQSTPGVGAHDVVSCSWSRGVPGRSSLSLSWAARRRRRGHTNPKGTKKTVICRVVRCRTAISGKIQTTKKAPTNKKSKGKMRSGVPPPAFPPDHLLCLEEKGGRVTEYSYKGFRLVKSAMNLCKN